MDKYDDKENVQDAEYVEYEDGSVMIDGVVYLNDPEFEEELAQQIIDCADDKGTPIEEVFARIEERARCQLRARGLLVE